MTGIDGVIKVTPTLLGSSLLRSHEGAFGAPRANGKTHQGIDIVANRSSADKTIYQVRATSSGRVAYARINGSENKGYGYTLVIDHQNGFYTLYSHLAINASAGLVNVGQAVSDGEVIGYLADPANGEKSSGNARAVAPYDKIQLHFECFEADPGLSSTARLALIKNGCTIDNPTSRLLALGYQSF
jgi:murein DD-endopeptidase MepM/ murein hydrolase activator NlpD